MKDKDEKKEAEKAMTSEAAPKVESLEGKATDVNTVEKSFLSFAEACDLVKSQMGLEDDEAVKSIVNIAFGLFGKE